MVVTLYITYALALAILIFSFINIKLSVALYMAFIILVPYMPIKIAVVSVSYNFINFALLFYIVLKYRKNLDYQILIPFLFLFFSLLILAFFTDGVPWSFQFNVWRRLLMEATLLPFILWNVYNTDEKTIKYIRILLIIAIIISGLYGIYLMRLGGNNPYTSFIARSFGLDDAAQEYQGIEARLSFSSAGKIQSTMNHPMRWVIHLCFLVCIFLAYYLKEKKKFYIPLIVLMLFNILIAGVRSGIAALAIGFVYFLILKGQIKTIFYGLIVLVMLSIGVSSNADLSNLFASFTDIQGNKSSVQGSSLTGRLDQLEGAYYETQGCELVGRGYGWHLFYQVNNGGHPILLGFESILYIVLCNSGILGIIIYIIFFGMLFKFHRKFLSIRENMILLDIMVIVFVSYAMATGDYGFLSIFSPYYTFLLCILIESEKKSDNQIISEIEHE